MLPLAYINPVPQGVCCSSTGFKEESSSPLMPNLAPGFGGGSCVSLRWWRVATAGNTSGDSEKFSRSANRDHKALFRFIIDEALRDIV